MLKLLHSYFPSSLLESLPSALIYLAQHLLFRELKKKFTVVSICCPLNIEKLNDMRRSTNQNDQLRVNLRPYLIKMFLQGDRGIFFRISWDKIGGYRMLPLRWSDFCRYKSSHGCNFFFPSFFFPPPFFG